MKTQHSKNKKLNMTSNITKTEIARRHGIETAAKLLRHADIKTCFDHYFLVCSTALFKK